MNQPENILVIAAVVDQTHLKLWQPDGAVISIPQGDPRVKKILDIITVPLSQNPGQPVSVSLSEMEPEKNDYAKYEEKTGGVVRFFRIAKAKLKNFFKVADAEVVDPIALGDPTPLNQRDKDQPEVEVVVDMKSPETKAAETQAAVEQIMATAIPTTHPSFNAVETHDKNSEDTIIAVVDNKVIPDAHNLRNQVNHAVNTEDSPGLLKFFERVASVKRSHSKEDLMKFMRRGDLPIADDGSIIAYKILTTTSAPTGKWVDCHTRNVPQQIGSYVCMDESLVDHNRANECSNGLHVARRQYLKNFGGDIMVLIKVAPEDVIAVPAYDANKMRVCGYHILFQLSEDDAKVLRNNQPMTENRQAAQLLHRALRGDHPAKLEEVRIGGQQGANIKITKLTDAVPLAPLTSDDPMAKAFENPDEISDRTTVAPVVEPQKVHETVKEVSEPAATTPVVEAEKPVLSRKEQAVALSNLMMDKNQLTADRMGAATKLRALKKTSKVSWEQLGLVDCSAEIAKVLGEPYKVSELGEPTKKAAPVKAGKFKTVNKSAEKKAAAPVKPVDNSVKKSYAEQIAELVKAMREFDGSAQAVQMARDIAALKKQSKKGYASLGVTTEDEQLINRLIG